jgi:hypothetical protein
MSESTRPIDVKDAIDNPANFFAEPKEVVWSPDLSYEQKLKILRAWEIDARLLSIADEEGMGGGEKARLGRVRRAIAELRQVYAPMGSLVGQRRFH